jgi:hypothetical protein
VRKIIVAACVITVCSIVAQACTRDCDRPCGKYKQGGDLRVLWDRYDCRDWHHDLIYPREFFDPSDFGRGHDSLYGDRHDWHDEDYSNFQGHAYFHHWHPRHAEFHLWHGRHRAGDSDPEGAVSERYVPPPPAPDMEDDE